jgi:hypothetical protein
MEMKKLINPPGHPRAAAAVRAIDISGVAGPCAGLAPGSAVLWELLPSNPLFLLNGYFGSTGMMPKWLGPLSLAMVPGDTGLHRFEAGDRIGPSVNWMGCFTDSHYFYHQRVRRPAWEAGGFIGFRAELSGLKVYGYLETTWDPDTGNFEIHSAAYDPGGAEILTPAAVPVSPRLFPAHTVRRQPQPV